MPQHQDFGFKPSPRLEAVAQHADEREAIANIQQYVLIRWRSQIQWMEFSELTAVSITRPGTMARCWRLAHDCSRANCPVPTWSWTAGRAAHTTRLSQLSPRGLPATRGTELGGQAVVTAAKKWVENSGNFHKLHGEALVFSLRTFTATQKSSKI